MSYCITCCMVQAHAPTCTLAWLLQVRSIEKFGVFVLLDHSNITALAHISNCADEFVTDLAQMFSPKQAVTGRVMDIGPGHKVSLSLKPSDVASTGDTGRGKAVGAGDAGNDLDEEMLEAAAAGGLDSDDDDAAAASDADDEGAAALGSDDDGDDEDQEGEEGDIDDLDIDAADLASSSDDEEAGSDSEAIDTEDEDGEEQEEEDEEEEEQEQEEEEEVLRGPDSLLDVGAAGPSGWGELRLEDDDTGAANGTGERDGHVGICFVPMCRGKVCTQCLRCTLVCCNTTCDLWPGCLVSWCRAAPGS